MAKFQVTETIHSEKVKTFRLGTAADAAGRYGDTEVGKAVKQTAESRYALCAAGDPIEGFISSINAGTYDGFSIGGVVSTGFKEVTFDGLQATPGTGSVAVGDFVVTGTVVAKNTALSGPLKVTKATNQPGATVVAADNTKTNIDVALAELVDQGKNAKFGWRVASLGTAGTGAVGTTGVIERVSI